MKTLFMLTDENIGGAQKICRMQAEHLKKHGVDVRLVNLRESGQSGRGFLYKVITLIKMSRRVRRIARDNPDAIFFASEHVFGIPCFFTGVPCHTRLATDMRRHVNRTAWIIYIRMLLWHKESRLYFLHQSLLDDCPTVPLWGRRRMRVLENPAPPHEFLPFAFDGNKPIDGVYIGRLHMGKNPTGFARLVEAINFPFAQLKFIGDSHPDQVAKFKKTITDSPIAHRYKTEFNGWHKNPWGLIERPSVMFITSPAEGWSGVVQEAFASGVPVISTCPTPATRFMLADGRGLDLAGMDETAAARAAREFLNNPDALNETRARARAWIEARQKIDYGAYLYDTLFGKGE